MKFHKKVDFSRSVGDGIMQSKHSYNEMENKQFINSTDFFPLCCVHANTMQYTTTMKTASLHVVIRHSRTYPSDDNRKATEKSDTL